MEQDGHVLLESWDICGIEQAQNAQKEVFCDHRPCYRTQKGFNSGNTGRGSDEAGVDHEVNHGEEHQAQQGKDRILQYQFALLTDRHQQYHRCEAERSIDENGHGVAELSGQGKGS